MFSASPEPQPFMNHAVATSQSESETDDMSSSSSSSSEEDGSGLSSTEPSFDELEDSSLIAHLELLRCDSETDDLGEIATSPLFTESVRQHGLQASRHHAETPFTQFGLLAGDVSMPRAPVGTRDPRIFQNIAAPSSVFICGSQGSGKSHTLSCLLENCLVPSKANVLPRPLTGIVFHYDTFISDSGGSPCEAAFLSSNAGVRVRVFCPPTNVQQIKVSLV